MIPSIRSCICSLCLFSWLASSLRRQLGVMLRLILLQLFSLSAYNQTIIPSAATTPASIVASAIHDETATTYAASSPLNWVRTYTPQAPLSDATQVVGATGYPQVGLATQYLDGLGRPLQTVSRSVTPQGKDLIAPVLYDPFGREVYKYLPYASATGTDGSFKSTPFSEQKTFMQQQYPGEQVYYAQTDYEPSPLNRVTKSMAAGNSWAGKGVGVAQSYELNVSGEVRLWTINTAANTTPTSNGFYSGTGDPDGAQLYRTVSKDENGARVVEYKDKEGQVVLKKVEVDVTLPESQKAKPESHTGWLCTYYVYDDLNNLRFVIPPKAVGQAIEDGWQLSATVISELCFYYEYDSRKRMTLKKVPGAGEVRMIYDSRDRLVMNQDANMRAAQQWMYIQYDELNRPVATGLLTDASHYNDADYHRSAAYSSTTYSSPAYPVLSSYTNVTELTRTYYDNYTWLSGTGLPASFVSNQVNETEFLPPSYSVFPYPQRVNPTSAPLTGLVTGTKIRVLSTSGNLYLYSATYYDDQRRPIQVHSSNITGGTDISTTQYTFDGKPLLTKQLQSVGSSPDQQYTTITRNEYDLVGRLINTYKRLNKADLVTSTPEKLLAAISYDELGQLKKKDLRPVNSQSQQVPLESLGYEYNIRGWLTGINKDYARGVSNINNWFGMQLSYDYGFQVASGGNDGNGGMKTNAVSTVPTQLPVTNYNYTGDSHLKATESIEFTGEFETATGQAEMLADIVPQQVVTTQTGYYNGNIAGTQWKSRGDGERRAYGFGYDAANRLLKADFSQFTDNGWNRHAEGDFSVKMGDGETPGLAYDANGNIRGMQQWGLKPGGSVKIDALTYDYFSQSNKLKSVSDAVAFVQGNALMGDFLDKNKVTDYANDYGYDVNGNLVTDLNKKLGSNLATGENVSGGGAIQYNHLNLPQMITVKSEDGTTTKGPSSTYTMHQVTRCRKW